MTKSIFHVAYIHTPKENPSLDALVSKVFQKEADALSCALEYLSTRLTNSGDSEEIALAFGDIFTEEQQDDMSTESFDNPEAMLNILIMLSVEDQYQAINRGFDYLDDDEMLAECCIDKISTT